MWFDNYKEELLSWDAFCLKTREVFGSPDGWAQAAKSKLKTGAQVREESFITHIEGVFWLCRKFDLQVVEADKADT